MEDKIKAPVGAIQNSRHEDNKTSSVMQQIKSFFLDGEKGTVVDIYVETGIKNPMKAINRLKKFGWKIMERDEDGLAFYWLDHEQRTQIINGVWKGGEI